MTFVCKNTRKTLQNPKVCILRSKNKRISECFGCAGPIEESMAMTPKQARKILKKHLMGIPLKHIKPLRYHDHIMKILSGPARKHGG